MAPNGARRPHGKSLSAFPCRLLQTVALRAARRISDISETLGWPSDAQKLETTHVGERVRTNRTHDVEGHIAAAQGAQLKFKQQGAAL
jgi:hypothetical protein